MSKFDVLILDVESYLYQACTACKRLQSVDERKEVYMEVYDVRLGIDYIQGVLKRFQEQFWCSNIVLVIGDKNSNFRKHINPSYKSHRTAKPLMYDILLNWIVDNLHVVSLPNLEADDICRVIYEDNENFKGDKLIITIDKDFYSFPCTLYRDNPKDSEIVTVSEEDARQNEFVQIIMGDKTDGYSGIPNYGEKKARNFVTPSTTWEDIVGIYKAEGSTEQEAIMNYNMAHIIGFNEYDLQSHNVKVKEAKDGRNKTITCTGAV